MNGKSIIWLGAIVGSSIGGAIPMLWGGSLLSISSVLLTAVGGIAGIWLGYRLTNF